MDPFDPNRQNPDRDGPEPDPRQPFDYREHYRRQNERYRRHDSNRAQQDPHSPHDWNQPLSASPADDERAFSILSYIGILWIVGLLAGRNNPTVKFHVNQGIILSIFEFILGLAFAIARAMVSAIFIQTFSWIVMISRLGEVINGLLSFTFWCIVLAFSVLGIVRAAQGRQEPLPLIGTLFQVIR